MIYKVQVFLFSTGNYRKSLLLFYSEWLG